MHTLLCIYISATIQYKVVYYVCVLLYLTDQRAERASARYLKEAGLGERGEQRQLTKEDFQIIKLISNGAYRCADYSVYVDVCVSYS